MLNNGSIYMYVWINLQGSDAEWYVWNFAERSKLYCTSKTTDGSCQEEATRRERETKAELFIKHWNHTNIINVFSFKNMELFVSDVSPVHMNSAHINFNINNNYLSKYIHKETGPSVKRFHHSHCRSWEDKIKYVLKD